MKVTTTHVQTLPILTLHGRFDAHEVSTVSKELKPYSQQPPANILVDLADVTFIDSQGLATLVQVLKHCREHGGDLQICNLAQPVRIIFELTRLDKAFTVHPDRATAVAAMLSSPTEAMA